MSGMSRNVAHGMPGSWRAVCFSASGNQEKEFGMKKLLEKLAVALVPLILAELVRVLEDMLEQDLDGDGSIG